MKVLVLGATGFIGFPVAQAFVRAGYEVFGQTRSENKVKQLTEEEIIPVVANPQDSATWSHIVEEVDVVVDCIGGNDVRSIAEATFEIAVKAAQKARGPGAPKLTFIYTSGTWVHGSDLTQTVSERAPVKNTVKLVQWRPAQEHAVTSSTVVDGIVIRPSLLYGRSGSIVALLFAEAAQAASQQRDLVWVGEKGSRWATIHADDLADAYLRIAEASPIAKGLAFDISNDATESVDDVLANVARISGAAGYEYRQPSNPFEEGIATTSLLRPSLARSLVGWRPRKASLVDGLKTYYEAWKASQLK